MKRFQFRLESVLNYKKYLERLAQQEAAKAHLDVRSCETMIRQLETSRDEQAREVDTHLQGGISARAFKRYNDFFQGVEYQLEYENKRRRALKYIHKEKIKKLKQKSVDKKVMELYRERKKQQYNQQLIKEEQKELDEIVSLKTARKVINET